MKRTPALKRHHERGRRQVIRATAPNPPREITLDRVKMTLENRLKRLRSTQRITDQSRV
jgi:hypothetical protein